MYKKASRSRQGIIRRPTKGYGYGSTTDYMLDFDIVAKANSLDGPMEYIVECGECKHSKVLDVSLVKQINKYKNMRIFISKFRCTKCGSKKAYLIYKY